MRFKNIITGKIIGEEDYRELLLSEYTQMWENDTIDVVQEFKEDGKDLNYFILYMMQYDVDLDFKQID